MIKYLERYRTYVWNDKKLAAGKATYFIHLADNARMQNMMGEAIFFYEKADKELELQGRKKSGQVLMQQCYLYTQNKNFKKATEVYEKELPWITSLPEAVRNGKIDEADISLSVYILSPVASAYVFLKDTANAEKTIGIAHSILQATEKNKAIGKTDRAVMQFLYEGMLYFKNRHLLNDEYEAHQALNSVSALVRDTALPEQWRSIIDFNLTDWRLDYFTHYGQADSAQYYLDKFKKMPSIMGSDGETALRIKGYELKIWGLRTGNQAITTMVDEMLETKDTLNTALNDQIGDMLYAYTKAEFSEAELKKAASEKRRLYLIIGLTITLALLSATWIYVNMRRRAVRIREQLETVNSLANLKIAVLEEAKQAAVKDEREKIAQELHDDLSGMAAAAKHQIDVMLMDQQNQHTGKELIALSAQVQNIYEASRSKSHEWFYKTRFEQQASFAESLQLLADNSLPGRKYKKTVDIEMKAVSLLSYDQRIHVLRILQEAMTNIIKHSKADEVNIFLCSNKDGIIFEVADNGMVHKPVAQIEKGVGLRSIKTRAAQMNGRLHIQNDEGLVLTVMIPLIQADLIE